jgi:glycosyltransferase involved in cell wall biosynthesis
MSRPLVTVLLPVHNGADHLRASLASVLTQSFRDFELLAIDDASTDETAAILAGVADDRLRVLRHERNLGLTATLNRGIAEALGAYIARQDADDLSDPGRLGAQVARLEAEPGLALLGCSYRRIDEDGREAGLRPVPTGATAIRWRLLFLSAFAHSSVMIRASALADVGPYDERFAYAQDYELWSRIALAHEIAALPEPLVSYRRSGSSLTATFAGAAAEIDAISTANVDRVLEAAGVDRAAIAGFDREAAWRLLFAGADGVDPAAAPRTAPAILALQAAFAAASGLDPGAARRHRAATARRLVRGLGRLAVRERDPRLARVGLKALVSSRRAPPASPGA